MSICESCHSGCCRTFAVPVTGADILRIERDLGLSFWDFACRWADPEGTIARQYAPHFHFVDEPQTPFVVALAHSTSVLFVKTTKCRFLIECPSDSEHPLGQARCGVYGSRPAACRVFPAKLNEAGDLATIESIPEFARDANEPAYRLCPRPWEPSDLDPLTTLHDLVIARYEMDFFRNVADIWNRDPQPWSVFPDFLHFIYERRILPNTSPSESVAEARIVKLPTDNLDGQARIRSKAA